MVKKIPGLLKILFLLGDCLITAFCVHTALWIVLSVYPVPFKTGIYYQFLPLNIIVMEIFFNIYGLFTLYKKRYSEIFIGIFLSIFYAFIIMMAVSFFTREFSYSRSVLLLTMIFELVVFNLWRYLIWHIFSKFIQTQRVLIIGGKTEQNKIVHRLSKASQLKYEVVHVLASGVEDWEEKLWEVDVAIICSDVANAKKEKIVDVCQKMQKKALLQPSIYELYFNDLNFEKIDDIPFFQPQYLDISLEKRTLKRIFDIFFSAIVLICLCLPMLFIALAIKLDSKGPVFYKQKRVGRDGKEFFVYKFRSMKNGAEKATGPVLAGENDARITKVGNFLRRTRLDEFPQFMNVLRGEMSTVGPRPERPFFVEKFMAEMPEYQYRHNVKPGITGMAQVYGKYNTTAYDKLIYDLLYIQKYNLFTDFVIIVQTVRVLFQKSSTEGV